METRFASQPAASRERSIPQQASRLRSIVPVSTAAPAQKSAGVLGDAIAPISLDDDSEEDAATMEKCRFLGDLETCAGLRSEMMECTIKSDFRK